MGSADPTGLLERDAELTALGEALSEARAGRGSVVAIEGAAGIGKTSLLAAAGGLPQADGLRTLSARGAELERELPFGVVRQLLAPSVRGADEAERDRLLAGAAARCAPLVMEEAAPLAGADARAEIVNSFYWLLVALVADGPLLLTIDDAHWADPHSLDVLAFLAPRADELGLLALVATRPPQAGWHPVLLGGASEIARLRPQPLSGAAIARFVSAELTDPADERFVGACREVTGGNPFYLRELVRELAADQTRPTAAGAARLSEFGPDTVARAVFARIATLPIAAVSLSQVLAVLGEDCELRHAAALAGLSPSDAAEAAAGLTRADVLADRAAPRFTHPIVRAAIYADLAGTERSQLHGEAAQLLHAEGADAARAAQHLLKAEPLGADWVVDALRTAASEATAGGSPTVAAAFLRRALAEPRPADRPGLLRELGSAEFVGGEPGGGLDHLEQALELSTDGRGRALAAGALASPLLAHGRVPEALVILADAAAALGEDDADLSLELEAERSGLALIQVEGCNEVMEPLRRYEEAAGRVPAERVLLAHLGYWHATTGGDAAHSAALVERALDGGLLTDTSAASPAFMYAVFVLIAADHFELADGFLADALADARRRASPVAFVAASSLRSLSGYRQGDLDAAEAEARAAVLSAREHGWEDGFPLATAFLADALVDRGRLDEARAALAPDRADDEPDRPLLAQLLVARGRLALAEGDLRGGADDLIAGGRLSERGGTTGTAGTPTFRTYAAPALAALGEREEADRLIERELEITRAWGAARGLGMALTAAGVVSGGERGVELLREAVATLEPTPARLEHARALLALGEALRRGGSPAEARDPLRAAARLARKAGADGLADRAEAELAASGARRLKRALLDGSASLTPSERRIADLAADGMSNREIAQALFLTRKTIETHLSHAYGKLGIGGRGELAETLRDPP